MRAVPVSLFRDTSRYAERELVHQDTLKAIRALDIAMEALLEMAEGGNDWARATLVEIREVME